MTIGAKSVGGGGLYVDNAITLLQSQINIQCDEVKFSGQSMVIDVIYML